MVDKVLQESVRTKLYYSHVRGAVIRSVASIVMWLFAWFAYWIDEIRIEHFIGISCSVLFLAFFMPLTLIVLKRLTHESAFNLFSVVINLLVVFGYTGVIYSLGGFEATYLTPIYAALITYWGVMEEKSVPYVIASFCALAFCGIVFLEGAGLIPSLQVDPDFDPSLWTQFLRVAVVIALLFIVAYIASFAAGTIKQGRQRLHQQNRELEEKATLLEASRESLKQKNDELQQAMDEIKTLKGTIPICAYCHSIRDSEGAWSMLEAYISKHSTAEFSHGICPACRDEQLAKLHKK